MTEEKQPAGELSPSRRNLLASPAGRRWLFAALYVSEGAPIGFVWWAMPSLLREQGLDLASITMLTSVATLPWILKFLMAPVIDASLRRGALLTQWALACQLAMVLSLLPLTVLDWSGDFSLVVAVVLIHAAFAATQDVAIDTLAIETVPAEELGRVNGSMQAGMLAGRASVAAGSGVLAAAFDTPGASVVCVMALIIAPALLLITAVKEPRVQRTSIDVKAVLRHVRTPAALAGAAVALLIGAGFEFFGVSVGPRFVDQGQSDTARAIFYGFVAPAGLAVGALGGGILTDRLGGVRATTASLVALSLALLLVAVDDLVPSFHEAALPLFGVVYLLIGALTASSYALFMTLSRGEFAATRFSVFMAMTNACEAWSGFVGGRLAVHGYGLALISLTAISWAATLPLFLLGKQERVRRDR